MTLLEILVIARAFRRLDDTVADALSAAILMPATLQALDRAALRVGQTDFLGVVAVVAADAEDSELTDEAIDVRTAIAALPRD